MLTRTELRWARATLEAIFPSNACPALPEGIAALDIEGHLQATQRRAPAEARLGIRAAIWIVALAPLFVLGRLATIASLPVGDRERVVRAVLTSRIYFVRQLAMFFKQLGALLYAGTEAIREGLLGGGEGLVSTASLALPRRRSHAGA